MGHRVVTLACHKSITKPSKNLIQDLGWKLKKVPNCASEGSKVVELLLDERQIHCRLLCEVRTLARRCLRMCRHPVGRHFMYLVTFRSLFKGESGKMFFVETSPFD